MQPKEESNDKGKHANYGSEKKQAPKPELKPKFDLDQNLLAAYTPDDDLENLCNNFNNSYRGESVVVLSVKSLSFPNSDSLLWINPEEEMLSVEIFNNKAQLVHSSETSLTGIKIPELENGLYYWKLINEDFDLLFVGKIRVSTK